MYIIKAHSLEVSKKRNAALTTVLIRHLWKLKIVVFLHWCLIHAVLLPTFLPEHMLVVSVLRFCQMWFDVDVMNFQIELLV
jgi:hypothetical protein